MATLREAPGVAGHHCRRRGVSAAPCFPVKDLFRDRSLAALREARTGLTQAGRVSAGLCPQVIPCACARFWSRKLNASFVVRGSVPFPDAPVPSCCCLAVCRPPACPACPCLSAVLSVCVPFREQLPVRSDTRDFHVAACMSPSHVSPFGSQAPLTCIPAPGSIVFALARGGATCYDWAAATHGTCTAVLRRRCRLLCGGASCPPAWPLSD